MHDFGALVVSLRSKGQTVGDVAGRVLNRRVRLLFLLILFMALTIVLAIFGLVIAAVFKQYPASIFPCLVQIPIAVAIGVWLHRKNVHLLVPSLIALAAMYLTLVFGNVGHPGYGQRDFMAGLVDHHLGRHSAGLFLRRVGAAGVDAAAAARLHQFAATDHGARIGRGRA